MKEFLLLTAALGVTAAALTAAMGVDRHYQIVLAAVLVWGGAVMGLAVGRLVAVLVGGPTAVLAGQVVGMFFRLAVPFLGLACVGLSRPYWLASTGVACLVLFPVVLAIDVWANLSRLRDAQRKV